MNGKVGRFIAGVGALVWDESSDRYLILHRSGEKDFAPSVWECVTGRLNQGEGFDEALHREVEEETGLAVEPLIILGTSHFFRGEALRENELVGIVYYCRAVGKSEVQLSQEHSEYRWVTAEEANDLLGKEHPTEVWLLKVIDRAEKMRRGIPDLKIYESDYGGFDLDS